MRIVSLLIAPAFLLASCNFMGGQRVSGNGHITTRDRQVGSFSRVDVSGDVAVHIRQDGGNSVRIETDENLMEYVDVYTNGNTVVIRTKQGYNLNPSKQLIAYVSAPSFEEIGVSGACDIIGETPVTGSSPLSMHVSGDGDIKMEVDVPSVSTDISGSGSVTLKGKAGTFNADVSGSGDIKCFDLTTDNSKLDLSGDSDAEVTVNKQLDVTVSGSGDVRYRGAANVSQRVSGSGSVKKEG